MSESNSSRFSVRLTPEENLRLQQLADAWKVKRSMAVRLLIQRTFPSSVFTPVGVFTSVGTERQLILNGGSHERT